MVDQAALKDRRSSPAWCRRSQDCGMGWVNCKQKPATISRIRNCALRLFLPVGYRLDFGCAMICSETVILIMEPPNKTSFSRKRESSYLIYRVPAFAGTTKPNLFSTSLQIIFCFIFQRTLLIQINLWWYSTIR